MRKLFSLFVAFFVTTTLWAYDFQSGDLYYNITSSSAPYFVEVTYKSLRSNYSNATLTIPAQVEYNGTTYAVTGIGNSAFLNAKSLTSVSIPSSVVNIGVAAFSYCYNLKTIYYSGTATGAPWDAENATVITE